MYSHTEVNNVCNIKLQQRHWLAKSISETVYFIASCSSCQKLFIMPWFWKLGGLIYKSDESCNTLDFSVWMLDILCKILRQLFHTKLHKYFQSGYQRSRKCLCHTAKTYYGFNYHLHERPSNPFETAAED